jgi:DNA-binding MarR family transcriptional regulator
VLEDVFIAIYDRLKLDFYRQVFASVKEREGSLSAMEAISLEVISYLGRPTISQFANFIIFPGKRHYKVNSLITKGYIRRQNSTDDKREYLWSCRKNTARI